MKLKFILAALTATILFSSCSKDEGDGNNNGNYRLASVSGNFFQGDALNFEYDNNRLARFSLKYNKVFHVHYTTDGKVDYIVYDEQDYSNTRASVIFRYGANGKCNHAYYKDDSTEPLTSDYYNDLTDNDVLGTHDSIIYDGQNRVSAVFRKYKTAASNDVNSVTRFSYPSTTSDVPSKIEEYDMPSGVEELYDQLVITVNDIQSPYSDLWFFPYLEFVTYTTESSLIYMPVLMDDPSTYLGMWLTYVPKCITHYEVNNTWGSYNYTDTYFNYETVSETLLKVAKQGNSTLHAEYTFVEM